MNFFDNSKAKAVLLNDENQYQRIESCLPLDYLSVSTIVGIGCGGAREFYIDMARMGVKNFVLMDGDDVSITNVSSQNVYLDEVGKKKVEVIKNRLLNINPEINVTTLPFMLSDDFDDEWIKSNIVDKNVEKMLICAFTDNFLAQARVINIALKFGIPFLAAQHHQYGETSEIVYWYPDVTKHTPIDALKNRYDAYEEGYKNSVTSEGSPIFNTVRLNALCEKIAIGMLLFGKDKYNKYSHFLLNSPEKNLILIRQNNLLGSNSTFVHSFNNNNDVLFDDPLWVEPESFGNKPNSLDTRVIFK